MKLKLSILDQSPFHEDETGPEALRHTVELVQKAEAWGYHRFWVSEHHDSDGVAGSSPEVLISHLLAKTERIRIGSGGVMLQHYSPYKVAENFNVLSALAPGRVDLGIGRAPGGLPRSTKALQPHEGSGSHSSLREKLIELEQHLTGALPSGHPLEGVRAVPLPEQASDIYLLGTSAVSAVLAAELGIPYVFAQFINGDEQVIHEALSTYRQQYASGKTQQPQPHAIVALSVILADTEEEAQQLASEMKNVKIHLASGRTLTVKTVESAEEYGRQSKEDYTIEVKPANVIHGSKDTVRRKLIELQQAYQVDEFLIVIPALHSFEQRVRAYEQLQEAFAEQLA